MRDADADLPGGDLLDRVRFIENDEVVWKKITAFAFFLLLRASQKHEEQRVIDHDHVGRQQPFARLLVKTVRILPAAFSCADVRLAANLRPNFWVGLDRQIAERAVAGRARPLRESRQLILLRPGEKLVLLLERAFQPPRAKIILPPFHERGFELNRQNLL